MAAQVTRGPIASRAIERNRMRLLICTVPGKRRQIWESSCGRHGNYRRARAFCSVWPMLFGPDAAWVLSTSTIRPQEHSEILSRPSGTNNATPREKGEGSGYDVPRAQGRGADIENRGASRARGEWSRGADPSRLQLEYPPLAIYAMALITRLRAAVPSDWDVDERLQESAGERGVQLVEAAVDDCHIQSS